MSDELREIISSNRLRSVFQPIISMQTGEVIGYEALTRGPKDSKYINPEILFEAAKTHDLLWDLEITCRKNAIKAFSSHNSDKFLFVNIDPAVLKDDHFIKGFTKELLAKYNISPTSLIFEITEKTSIDCYENFSEVIDYYKNQGYKIAIDDVGTGYSGLTTIAKTRPNYIKMDMSLITNVTRDNFKKAIIKSFVDFANSTNTKIIAEGIEDVNDLYTLIEIGVHYGQGFLINRPADNLMETPEIIKKRIVDKNINMKKHSFSPSSNVKIGEIAREESPVLSTTTCSEIDKLFKSNHSIRGISVVNNNYSIIGVVMNSDFFSKVGTQYGWSIYMKRPIHLIMDSNPLIVDYDTTLDIVSKIVISREEDKLYDYIIVKKNDKYFGVVPVISLLEKTMEFELNVAKYSNPLTGLPGNVVIEDFISKLIIDKKKFSLLYFDINDFKAFNDKYGFENGDRILSFTSSVIQKHTCLYKDSFLGHIGGDDFVAIILGHDAYNLCEEIINEFDNNIINFYNEYDRENKYIQSVNRNNINENYPLMSISIAIVINKNKSYTSIFELTEEAARIKKKCKLKSKELMKSCYIV
ncbi:EAL domain-containing protein [Clostridium estertheticum]|uniref:EAL domain-containing protein n=1 Tax=Clostridium estertheticum TaxID=238834 RepID=A0AA47EMY9_9CLOT|nr:EAL domain-containing protein [Clostridium estertheticum]MBU3154599.1 EAL domain-containing protein [Clostridium estertheticum]MBU3201053.1 EAL domain-containing protein [Clostridium estertheticum]WAG61971.1 EAL domain-containing protein [Clostridium estertheticum]WAG63907.1 EAL domain-containing protein [Clostridium estertheticum]